MNAFLDDGTGATVVSRQRDPIAEHWPTLASVERELGLARLPRTMEQRRIMGLRKAGGKFYVDPAWLAELHRTIDERLGGEFILLSDIAEYLGEERNRDAQWEATLPRIQLFGPHSTILVAKDPVLKMQRELMQAKDLVTNVEVASQLGLQVEDLDKKLGIRSVRKHPLRRHHLYDPAVIEENKAHPLVRMMRLEEVVQNCKWHVHHDKYSEMRIRNRHRTNEGIIHTQNKGMILVPRETEAQILNIFGHLRDEGELMTSTAAADRIDLPVPTLDKLLKSNGEEYSLSGTLGIPDRLYNENGARVPFVTWFMDGEQRRYFTPGVVEELGRYVQAYRESNTSLADFLDKHVTNAKPSVRFTQPFSDWPTLPEVEQAFGVSSRELMEQYVMRRRRPCKHVVKVLGEFKVDPLYLAKRFGEHMILSRVIEQLEAEFHVPDKYRIDAVLLFDEGILHSAKGLIGRESYQHLRTRYERLSEVLRAYQIVGLEFVAERSGIPYIKLVAMLKDAFVEYPLSSQSPIAHRASFMRTSIGRAQVPIMAWDTKSVGRYIARHVAEELIDYLTSRNGGTLSHKIEAAEATYKPLETIAMDSYVVAGIRQSGIMQVISLIQKALIGRKGVHGTENVRISPYWQERVRNAMRKDQVIQQCGITEEKYEFLLRTGEMEAAFRGCDLYVMRETIPLVP